MNLTEYNEVATLSYLEYCDYLQEKHGVGKYDFMTKSWNKNSKSTRTKEGLIAHHKFEDHAIMLSTKEFAMQCPFEWQLAENLIYCDYLEHLLLHVLICESPIEEETFGTVGVGGVMNFIAPELNDLYSGWQTNQPWRANCHELVAEDKAVYLEIIKRFKANCRHYPCYEEEKLYRSFNETFGLWSSDQNSAIYKELKAL
ncbi:MAG: hypothetical protein R3Y07_03550 [Eubacteriales bacterium]